MNLEKYKTLTGTTVSASQEAKVKAVIRRTNSLMETLLGFSLRPKNLYTEVGQVRFEGYLPIIEDLNNLDSLNLLPPDEEQGRGYKLFPYEELDKYFHVDPFTAVYKVKLVFPLPNGEFLTITDLDNVAPSMGRDGIGKYIERHYEWFTWEWYRTYRYSWKANSDAGLMLAVDADWIDCYPTDLEYLWADMIEYYTAPTYSITGNLKSESVDGHSWSRASANANVSDEKPESNPSNKMLLARYAGPYGSVSRNPVR